MSDGLIGFLRARFWPSRFLFFCRPVLGPCSPAPPSLSRVSTAAGLSRLWLCVSRSLSLSLCRLIAGDDFYFVLLRRVRVCVCCHLGFFGPSPTPATPAPLPSLLAPCVCRRGKGGRRTDVRVSLPRGRQGRGGRRVNPRCLVDAPRPEMATGKPCSTRWLASSSPKSASFQRNRPSAAHERLDAALPCSAGRAGSRRRGSGGGRGVRLEQRSAASPAFC